MYLMLWGFHYENDRIGYRIDNTPAGPWRRSGHAIIDAGLDGPRPETEAKIPAKLENFPVVVKFIGPLKAQ